MKVLVSGSTGGSGRAAVHSLLADGHRVTAFVRRVGAWPPTQGLTEVVGDAPDPADVERAVKAHDAVVVALGISEATLKVRLFGASGTSLQVRSRGTRNAISAVKEHGVRRLVVQSSYGVGPTRERLNFAYRLYFSSVHR
jgi:nucleoside-diphosphate-sugar epimerase